MAKVLTEKEAAAKYMALKAKEKRSWTRLQLILEMAKAQGIEPTEAEVDARVLRNEAKKA